MKFTICFIYTYIIFTYRDKDKPSVISWVVTTDGGAASGVNVNDFVWVAVAKETSSWT